MNPFSESHSQPRFACARRSATGEESRLYCVWMRLPRAVGLLVWVVGTTLLIAAQAASPRERRFFSARQGVGIEAPPGWTISQHTGYPSILVLLLHADGSRISVSAAPTTASDARGLVEQNRRGLQAQRLTITKQSPGLRGGIVVDARATDRDEVVRQLYLVRSLRDDSRQAVVVTLVTKPARLADAGSGFEWALSHLTLEAPLGKGDDSPDAGRKNDGSASEGTAAKERR